MTAFLQPDFTSIWADLDETIRQTVFPLLTGDARREILDVTKQAFDEEARAGQLQEKAVEALFWRDVKKTADRLDAERSGANDAWAPVDIGASWDREQQLPDVGEWPDGHGIFYAGKVNEVHGPSESGKTMFVLAVAAQEIRAGRDVIMVDYEDDPDAVAGRLRWVFGLEREEAEKHFHYFNPGRSLTDEALEKLSQIPATLCIIDAVTEAMSCSGLDGRNENEVAAWYAEFPKRLAGAGMAVALIDHTSKTNHETALGSQHKKSAITGVSYTAKPVAPFTKGHRGELSIRVAKDKLGGIRPNAIQVDDGQPKRGSLVIDGTSGETEVLLDGVGPESSRPTIAPEAAPETLPEATERQMVYLKALNFYEDKGTSPAYMARYMEVDLGYPTDGPNVRNTLIALGKKGLASQPAGESKWFITPLGVAVIARELTLGASWVERNRPRRKRKTDLEQTEILEVSQNRNPRSEEVSQTGPKPPTKPTDETSETNSKPFAKPPLTCDETKTSEIETNP